MKIAKRMKRKHSNVPVQSSALESQREALGTQIVSQMMTGKSPDQIAVSLNITPKMVNRLARERLGDQMELIDDMQFQRHMQLMKVRALSDSRFQPAIDGDNIAMNQMIKLIPMENGLLGLDDRKSIQEIVVNGKIQTESTVTNVSEIGERAAAIIDKYMGAESVDQKEAPNTHKPNNDMGELMSKLGKKPKDDDIVDAEIVEDEDGS